MRAILTFHSLDTTGSVLSYHPRHFASLLEALDSAGIPVVDLDGLFADPDKSGVVLTFDDGMSSVYEHALPVLRDHGVPAHLFLVTGRIGLDNAWPSQTTSVPHWPMLDWTQIERLHEAGVHIESHTHNHPDLRTLNADMVDEECCRADDIIEARLERRPRYFAYPYGYFSTAVREQVRSRYTAALTTSLASLSPSDDLAALPRIDTYYLRSALLYRRLNSLPVRGYLFARRLARTLRGH